MIRFSIPETLPTVNVLLRMHWRERGRLQRRVARLVWEALAESRQLPNSPPMPRVRVHVKRYSSREPDPDGIKSSAKMLMDALQPSSKRHPYGLGVIAGDGPGEAEVDVVHVGKRVARTDVEIEPL